MKSLSVPMTMSNTVPSSIPKAHAYPLILLNSPIAWSQYSFLALLNRKTLATGMVAAVKIADSTCMESVVERVDAREKRMNERAVPPNPAMMKGFRFCVASDSFPQMIKKTMDAMEYALEMREISMAVPPSDMMSNGMRVDEHPTASLNGMKL